MRLKINFNGTKEKLPINNQHIINSFFHKLLGKNNKYHDPSSNYNVSGLWGSGKSLGNGGKEIGGGEISFFGGGYITISSLDLNLLSLVVDGINKNKIFYKDIHVIGYEFLPGEKFYDGINHTKR